MRNSFVPLFSLAVISSFSVQSNKCLVRLVTSEPGVAWYDHTARAADTAERPGCGCAGVMAVVMLLGAFPFDHARQHEGAVDDEALDLWCAPGLALETFLEACYATLLSIVSVSEGLQR